MIITVKNLQQQTFTIDFDSEKTVLELKKQIFNDRGVEYVVEKQKLIYAGVILTDERTISSYKVDEKKFIVVMLTRDISGSSNTGNTGTAATTTDGGQQERDVPKVTAAKVSSVDESQAENTPTEPVKEPSTNKKTAETTDRERSDVVNNEPATPSIPPALAAATTDYSSIDLVGELANASLQTRAESNLVMGEEYSRTVASMVEMGYARDQVERAMAASFYNPDRAVEYLITGIPQEGNLFNTVDDEDQSRASNLRQESLSDLQTESTSDPFEFLRSQPQFLQMRSLIYQNPHLLHAVLQQIGQTNPALLQLISENQDAFLNMLNQPLEGEVGGGNAQRFGRTQSNTTRTENLSSLTLQNESTSATVTATAAAASAAAAAEVGRRSVAGAEDIPVSLASPDDDARTISTEMNVPQSESMATIRLTPQDQDAIERLKALGFSEALVLQAYFACEKNEQLAANFLLSSTFDD